MNIKILLGAAAGAGIAYFLTTPKGQEVLGAIGKKVSESMGEGEGMLSNASDLLGSLGKKVAKTNY